MAGTIYALRGNCERPDRGFLSVDGGLQVSAGVISLQPFIPALDWGEWITTNQSGLTPQISEPEWTWGSLMETPVIYMIILILKSVFHSCCCKPPAQILFISHLLSQQKNALRKHRWPDKLSSSIFSPTYQIRWSFRNSHYVWCAKMLISVLTRTAKEDIKNTT